MGSDPGPMPMGKQRESLEATEGAVRPLGRRRGVCDEFALGLLATAMVLLVLAHVEAPSRQRRPGSWLDPGGARGGA